LTQIDFWTPKQIADELDLSAQYVYQIIKGRHPSLTLNVQRIGGRWLVSASDAQRFMHDYRNPQHYSPQEIATAIKMSRKYVLDALTGYGGRKTPRLAGVKRGERWVIGKEEAEHFIREHVKREGLGD
jgi:predicted DNA-binding protein YlxM (UPF0122 family)